MAGGLNRRWKQAALFAAAFVAGGVTVLACADTSEPPSWSLAKSHYDPGGNSALLSPGNDTRTNLLLLLADRRGAPVRDPAAKADGPPLVLFPWRVMAAAVDPPEVPEEADADLGAQSWTPSRCQSNPAGKAAFVAAVEANAAIPDPEKRALAAARASFAPTCSDGPEASPPVAAGSPAGKAFAAYLAGAADFYGGRFEDARAAFSGLAQAPDPWLRETALYMVARTELNRAQLSSFDEYGGLAEPEQRDRPAIAAAGAAFGRYLAAYPEGRYASSARGLTRRVAWLAGDHAAAAEAFERQLTRPGPFDGAEDAVAIAEEIDHALLMAGGGTAARDPLLLAVVDLERMRCFLSAEPPADPCEGRLTREELERQAPLFASEPALYGYLRAAHAFYVRSEPREVLALIPDAARQPRFTYLEFSRQMLRGLALDATGDRNARGFWLSLFDGAVAPYQREALELALALHDERSGGIARIFASDSKVRHPVIRQLLLEHVAGPGLLRQQARDARAPKQEREVATYILLAKQLRRGFYRDFLNDLPLVPADLPEEAYYTGAAGYDAYSLPELAPPPLRRFAPGAPTGDAACPKLPETVRQLAANPQAIGGKLCLAEYFRSNGFDEFPMDEPPAPTGLASSKPQFPGSAYSRLEVYKSIIADPRALPDQRAWALNRAIRCYGPSGYNSCGGVEVGETQRAAWFQRLKRDHSASRWAQTLKYYW